MWLYVFAFTNHFAHYLMHHGWQCAHVPHHRHEWLCRIHLTVNG